MNPTSHIFKGIGASPGIAIGSAFILDKGQLRLPKHHIHETHTERELLRLKKALDLSVHQMVSLRTQFSHKGMAHHTILEAHEMMLRDQTLYDSAVALIASDRINAEWAVSRVIAQLKSVFDNLIDPYFKERGSDIDFVGERILRNLTGQHRDLDQLEGLHPHAVIVAHDLSPVDTALLAEHHISAFVTEVGGKTSHTSIIARSLEVPAVVGVKGLLDAVGTGELLVVDGLEGSVVLRPQQSHVERGQRRLEKYRKANEDLFQARALPACTLDDALVTVTGNIELPHEVSAVFNKGGEGIGLYRTEFMFVNRHTAPTEEEHYNTYCDVFKASKNAPVTIRTFDLGGDKNMGTQPVSDEPNPALGLRAVRYCLQHRDIFEPQLAGLLRAAVHGNVRILIPMVSGLDELLEVKRIIDAVKIRLTQEGKPYNPNVPIGVMIEIPSAVMSADCLAQHCDFFAIGTNDLIQYLLAIDRTNEQVAYLYHPLQPAVLRTLDLVVKAASRANIPVSVCGEMAGDVEYTAMLIGMGFRHLSMNTGSVPKVKRLIRELRLTECEELFKNALECHTATQVEALVHAFMAAKNSLVSALFGENSATT
jgi:phosphotransferase system enzyme I (PtsI)